MHITIAKSTKINQIGCSFSTVDAEVRSIFRIEELERMFGVGRITNLKWTLDAFFMEPFITLVTEIIVCTDGLERARIALIAVYCFWIDFFVVAPKQREYMMTVTSVIKERGSIVLEKNLFRYPLTNPRIIDIN
jgi:hypothetical protein